MRTPCRFAGLLAASLAVAATGPAQTQGSYAVFGQGCAGTAADLYCLSANTEGGVPFSVQTTPSVFYLQLDAQQTLVVQGFELLTRATSPTPISIKTEIYLADASGRPAAAPVRTGTMVIGSRFGWYRTTMAPPLLLKPSDRIFLAYEASVQMWFPYVTGGTPTEHYYRTPPSTLVTGPFKATAWTWRLVCAGSTGAATPLFSFADVPRIYREFTLMLDQADPNGAAGLITGASTSGWGPFRLPLDLTPAGAPGCSLLVSIDFIAAAPTDAQGKAAIPVRVPGDKALVGVTFHNQWLVLDPKANPLGLAFSTGGGGKIGD